MGLEFSQLVPGLEAGRAGPSNLGRSFGVIDAKNIGFVLDAVALLHNLGLPEATAVQQSLLTWFSAYYPWLSGSKHAKVEFDDTNK